MWDVKHTPPGYIFGSTLRFTLTMWDVKWFYQTVAEVEKRSFTLTMWDVKIYLSHFMIKLYKVLP